MADVVAAPSMAGVQSNTDDMKNQALDAMARGGKAGLDAFNTAQQNVQGYRQQVLGSILGTQGLADDAKSALQAKVESSLAPHLADLASGQANLQGDLARGNQQYANYAGMASAAVPVIQANQQTQAGIRDQALQLAQQQIDADKAAKAAEYAHQIQLNQLQLQQQQAQTEQARATAAAAAAKAVAPKPPTVKSLQGAATQAQDQSRPTYDSGNILQSYQPTTNVAAGIGAQTGADQNILDELYAPGTQSSLKTAQAKLAPPPPDVAWITKNVKGVSAASAQQYVGAPEWQQYSNLVDAFMNGSFVLDQNGNITAANGAPAAYVGGTPRQALSQYVMSLPGWTGMKNAALAYYGPTLDALTKK